MVEIISEKEKEECEQFINECKRFYYRKGDMRRFEDMKRKEKLFQERNEGE